MLGRPNGLPKVGQHWAAVFLKRKAAYIKIRVDRPKEFHREAAEDPEIIKEWFNDLANVIKANHIEGANIWNYDEIGFCIGQGKAEKLIFDVHRPSHARMQSGRDSNRDLISLCEAS